MKQPILYLLAALCVILVSCRPFYQVPAIERIHDVRLQDLTPDKTVITLSLEVKNPNCFGIDVNTMEVNVLDKNRERLGKIVLSKPIQIAKKTSRNVDFQITLDTRRVAKLVSYTTQNVFFYIQADAQVKVMGVKKKIDFEVPYDFDFKTALQNALQKFTTSTQTIDISQKDAKAPKESTGQEIFKVVKASVSEVSLTEFQFSIKFILLNPYGFAFTFVDFPCEVFINEKPAGKGYLAKPLNFNENVFSADGELVFKMNHLKSLLGASKGVLSGEIAYHVVGDVVINGFGMEIRKPFKFKGKTDVNPLKSKDK